MRIEEGGRGGGRLLFNYSINIWLFTAMSKVDHIIKHFENLKI